MSRKITIEIISLLLLILFVYAAISKVLDYDNFKVQLGKSPMLTAFSSFVAVGVPAIEILIAILLIGTRTKKLGLYASLILLLLFTFYLIAILNFSFYIPCSCGGILQNLSWKSHIIFNLFFIVLSITGIMLLPKEPTDSQRNQEQVRLS